ncbi:helix-turn-helix domain-containing protein [Pseudobacteriovorax antillogorgiicola]|nr:helix-turn-helix transcriptional regulator [Pseudobacteriovorax antillogorgiicola]
MNDISNQENLIRKNTIGQLIESHRRKNGITQKYLSESLGYASNQIVSNWERGLSQPPVDLLPKLATILKIDRNTLFDVIMDCQHGILELKKRRIKIALQ